MPSKFTGKYVAGLQRGDVKYPALATKKSKMTLLLQDDRAILKLSAWLIESHDVPVSEIAYIAYEDAGTTTNLAAVAAFGALGLVGSSEVTVITVGYARGDVVMTVRKSPQVVRAALLKAASDDCPSLQGRIHVGPPPLPTASDGETSASASVPPSDSMIEQLERLVSLHSSGAIDDDEFARLKAALIDGGT